MIDVLRAADVRAQDAAAEAAGTSVATLMEAAGWAVARAARGMLGGSYGRRVVVLCGKGNNGGDGLVAARILRAQGAHVTTVMVAEGEDASKACARADLVIDAMLGVGLSRAPERPFVAAIEAIDEVPVLAVDVPTGVDADTGQVPGRAVRADRTVTFSGLKPGLLFEPGASLAGEIEVAGIGAPGAESPPAYVLDIDDLAELIPQRAAASHKRNVGTVMVVAGSRAMPGAASLTTAAAIHGGAGLTILCAPEEACEVALARTPECTTIPVPASGEGSIDAKALELIEPRLAEVRAVALGPGLSTHPGTVDFVRALVERVEVPVVVDADGLNAFAGAPEGLRGAIVTPHAGELSRLTGIAASELEADRLGNARAIAERLGLTLVFKGPGTVIAGPDGCYVNVSGGAALAQGGTGDVLTGLVAAFVAQRGGDTSTVAAAVAVHGAAADRIAARLAPHPANASALIDELGPTMHEVLHG